MHAELQRIVDELTEYVGLGVQLTDVRLDSIVFGPHGGEIDWIRRESLLLRRTPPQVWHHLEKAGVFGAVGPLRIPADPELGMMSRVVVPARWHGVTYGYLWFLDDHYELTDEQLRHVTEMADEIGRLLHWVQRTRHIAVSRVSDLIAAPLEVRQRAAAELLESGAIAPATPVAVVVLQHHAADTQADGVDAALWDVGTDALPRAVLRVVEQNHTVLLVPLPRSGDLEAARTAAARLRRLYLATPGARLRSVVAGVSDPHAELVEAHTGYRQARLAARVADAVPELGPVAEWGRIGAFRALVSIPPDQLGSLALDPCVKAILDAGDASLLPTLETYLDSGCDVRDTSMFLKVHRGTIYYRLHKVETVSGLSLRDGLDRLTLHMSIKLGRLAGLIPHRARSG